MEITEPGAELLAIAEEMAKVNEIYEALMARGLPPTWADVEEVKTALVRCIEPGRGCFMWVESTGEELDPYPGSLPSKLGEAMVGARREAEKGVKIVYR